jgi:hypothetical protein
MCKKAGHASRKIFLLSGMKSRNWLMRTESRRADEADIQTVAKIHAASEKMVAAGVGAEGGIGTFHP